MFFLDTDIATLAFRKQARVRERIEREDPSNVRLPLPSKLEILRGRIEAVLKAANSEELIRARNGLLASEEFIAEFILVGIDTVSAHHFTRLRDNKKLKKIGVGDLLNAAIALAHDATLVTRNVKDFANVPGLTVENWAD